MRWWKIAMIVFALAFCVAQFIRPERSNSPADPRASFENAAHPPPLVAGILARACGNCHSDRTVWPWYSKVAPVSWLVASDVSEGRGKLNLSRWTDYSPEKAASKLKAMCSEMRSGDMPPWYYRPVHPEAKLTAEDVAAVCAVAP